jgi:hypothetical protein
MRAAVLINPSAGGAGDIQKVVMAIDAFLYGCEIVGGESLRSHTVVQTPQGGYIGRLHAAVDALCALQPDFYLVAGGDGLAAYLASRLLKTGTVRPKILGVAMGTANVGPIVSLSADDLMHAKPESLSFAGCGAIEAFDGDNPVAFGFNDVVFGNTILGTLGGKAQTISALSMAREGKKEPMAPLESIGASIHIIKNGVRSPSPLAHTAQIVVSAIERESFYGRAVAGMLCFTCWEQAQAALTLSERPLVVTDYDPRGFETPALSAQIVFGADDTLRIEGLSPEALVIADGNPYCRSFDSAALRYRPNVIEIAS